MMKLKQKEWMTLKEAAEYLNRLSQDQSIELSEIDIIRYAISGDLILSLCTFLSTSAEFGYYFPKGSRPPQPETDPPEHEGGVYYLAAPANNASLIDRYEAENNYSDDIEPDENAIWDGPAIALLDEEASIPPAVWDLLRSHGLREYLTRHLHKCLSEQRDYSQPTDLSGGDWSLVENDSDEGIYQLCLITPDKKGAALVWLPAILDNSILCVRPENIDSVFEEAKPESVSIPQRPKQKSELQKEAILKTLKNQLNLDPLNLPERKQGRNPGARAQCWEALKRNKQLFTYESFKTAWKNLRATGEIKGGN